MQRKQGKTIRSEARNIIRRVIRKCDAEAWNKQLFFTLEKATLRASDYCGVSIKTITRIRKEDTASKEDELLSSPGKKRPRKEEKKFHCSEEDKAVVRSIIYDLFTVQKIVPNGSKLLAAVKEKIYFPWEVSTLYRLLRSMGYKWRQSNGLRKILIERPDIISCRSKYLKAINYYRSQNRNIIYIDETWVDNTLWFDKCWPNEETLDVLKSSNPPHRLVIVHAGGRDGFVKGTGWIFKSGTTSEDNNGEISAENFERWVNETLIPNSPPKSVIVMDNAPCHSIELNKPPTKYSKKDDMIAWLVKNNISYTEDMRKYKLYELVEQSKKTEKVFKVDEILKLNGFDVLRLPKCIMSDLNPIESIWVHIKKILRENNTCTLSITELQELTYNAINQITESDWARYCNHVEILEKEYWRKDGLMEDIIDNLPLQTDEPESSSDESSSEDEQE